MLIEPVDRIISLPRKTMFGYEIFSSGEVTIKAGKTTLISTGLKIGININNVGILTTHPELSWTKLVEISPHIISHEDCENELHLLARNNGNKKVKIPHGSKVANLIILQISSFLNICESYDTVD